MALSDAGSIGSGDRIPPQKRAKLLLGSSAKQSQECYNKAYLALQRKCEDEQRKLQQRHKAWHGMFFTITHVLNTCLDTDLSQESLTP